MRPPVTADRSGLLSPCVLPTSVIVHDIRDAEGFVKATLKRSGIRFSPDEYDEMVAEGLAQLWELASAFEPRREGYAQEGRFSGYAARYLPGRIGRAWHRAHREHRQVVGSDGKRRWHYGEGPVSLDGMPAERREQRVRPVSQWLSVVATALAPSCATAPAGA